MFQPKTIVHRNNRRLGGTLCALVAMLVLPLVPRAVSANDHAEEAERIKDSIEVLQNLVATPDYAIPEYILDRAEAIVVIPSLVKGGLIVGAEHGKGVMSVRTQKSHQWSPPSFVTMTGGSFGWQIGLQSVDLVLVVMNREGVDDLLSSEFTLGGDASVAAGPVGRTTKASTDISMGAKILAYSRAKGLFAGATIEGASLRSDDDANRRFYGHEISAERLAAEGGSISMPSAGGNGARRCGASWATLNRQSDVRPTGTRSPRTPGWPRPRSGFSPTCEPLASVENEEGGRPPGLGPST